MRFLSRAFGNPAAMVSSYDADAQAFFDAAGITDGTQKSAVNTLVTSLKANSLWTPFSCLYPFVGGTSTTHKYNLKDPRDLDAAFRLTFAGTVTHDANGITGDGSTGYADTYFNFSSHGSQDSATLMVYCRTQTPTDNGQFMACHNGSTAACALGRSGASLLGLLNSFASHSVGVSTDFRGFCATTRTTATAVETKGPAAEASNNATASVAAVARQVSLLSRSYQGFPNDQFSNANLAFAAIGTGLTDGELDALKTIIDTFQSALSRNVP